MNIFVYEYTCCQPLTEGPATALRAEGRAMLVAILRDFAALDGVTVLTMLADGHPPLPFPGRRTNPAAEERDFRELAAGADWTLVIAPEFDGLLYHRCRWAEEAGGRLLGPGSQAVRHASDKLELWRVLYRWRRVPTPRAVRLALVLAEEAAVEFPAVCKPRHGAGSQWTFLVRSRDELAALARELPACDFVVQPLVAGAPASVAFLLGPGRCLPLPAAAQRLSADGRFRYLGGSAPLAPALARRARSIAWYAVQTFPLRGYVGVDVVLGDAPDGSADRVIEINSRLTTSYVGLRALARGNLAGALLALARREALPELGWHEGTVAWSADGTVATPF